MTPQPRILLAPASGASVGGGHVMRGLALAQALSARGAVCAFSCGPQGAQIINRYGGGRFAVIGDRPQQTGAAAFDALIVDDYQIQAAQETPLRTRFRVIMVIDDLADRVHDCDLLLDPGYGRAPAAYAGLVPKDAATLLGPAYALLRGEFAALRAKTQTRKRAAALDRLFINFGLSDVGAVAAQAYGALRPSLTNTQVDLVVASDGASVPKLRDWARTDANLTLHIDCQRVGDLMAEADAALGAGGASTWERACLGLPTLAIIVADNQRPMIEHLARDGVLLAVDLEADDFEARLRDGYGQLRGGAFRSRLAANASALCDGQGADRAAEALLGRLSLCKG